MYTRIKLFNNNTWWNWIVIVDYLFDKNKQTNKKKKTKLKTNKTMISSNKLLYLLSKGQRIWGQQLTKTIAKPVSVVKTQEKPIICNKVLYTVTNKLMNSKISNFEVSISVSSFAECTEWHWSRKHVPHWAYVNALCWVTENQLAIGWDGEIQVHEVTTNKTRLLYMLTWEDYYLTPLDMTVNGPMSHRILVLSENSGFVYMFPCNESSNYSAKFQISDDVVESHCIAASFTTAVIGVINDGNPALRVFSLPEFTCKKQINLDFVPRNICMTTDNLLVTGMKQVLVKKLNTLNHDLCSIEASDDDTFISATSTRIAQEIYISCMDSDEDQIKLYKYSRNKIGYSNEYVNSGCVALFNPTNDDAGYVGDASISISSSGMLAACIWRKVRISSRG